MTTGLCSTTVTVFQSVVLAHWGWERWDPSRGRRDSSELSCSGSQAMGERLRRDVVAVSCWIRSCRDHRDGRVRGWLATPASASERLAHHFLPAYRTPPDRLITCPCTLLAPLHHYIVCTTQHSCAPDTLRHEWSKSSFLHSHVTQPRERCNTVPSSNQKQKRIINRVSNSGPE